MQRYLLPVTGPVSGGGTGTSPNTVNLTESILTSDPSSGFLSNFGLRSSTNARTEYTVTKTITNNTGFAWTSFRVAVGCDPSRAMHFPRFTVPCFGEGANNPIRMEYDLLPKISRLGISISLDSMLPMGQPLLLHSMSTLVLVGPVRRLWDSLPMSPAFQSLAPTQCLGLGCLPWQASESAAISTHNGYSSKRNFLWGVAFVLVGGANNDNSQHAFNRRFYSGHGRQHGLRRWALRSSVCTTSSSLWSCRIRSWPWIHLDRWVLGLAR